MTNQQNQRDFERNQHANQQGQNPKEKQQAQNEWSSTRKDAPDANRSGERDSHAKKHSEM